MGSLYDITPCLLNCSNNGVCSFENSNFLCKCIENYYYGNKCDLDKRFCSSFQCFNNGECINQFNATTNTYDFECKCQFPFYGRRCESKIDLCSTNSTCVPNQGRCEINGTETICKCFSGYSGDNCEIISTKVKIVKSVKTGSIALTVCFGILFLGLILINDISNFYLNFYKMIEWIWFSIKWLNNTQK